MADMPGDLVVDEEAAYPGITDTDSIEVHIGNPASINTTYSETAYAESVSQYEVGDHTAGNNQIGVMEWLATINGAPIRDDMTAEGWSPDLTPELLAELDMINRQLENWAGHQGNTDDSSQLPEESDAPNDVSEIYLNDELVLSQEASFHELDGYNSSGFNLGPGYIDVLSDS